MLDRLGRCLKLIVSYRGTSSHEFASQFGLKKCIREKLTNHSRPDHRPRHRPSERRNNLKGILYLHARWRLTSHFTQMVTDDFVGAPKPPQSNNNNNNNNGRNGSFLPGWLPHGGKAQMACLRESYPRCNDPAKRGSVCADAGLHSQVICTCVSLKFIQITGNS